MIPHNEEARFLSQLPILCSIDKVPQFLGSNERVEELECNERVEELESGDNNELRGELQGALNAVVDAWRKELDDFKGPLLAELAARR